MDPVNVTGQRPALIEQINRWVYDQLFNQQSGPSLPEQPVGGAAISTTSGENNDGACSATGGSAPLAIGNPILPATGNKVESEIDFESAGEFPLYLRRTYNKHYLAFGIFGRHWITNFDLKLSKASDGNTIHSYRNDGSRITYTLQSTPSPGWYHQGSGSKIVATSDGGYVLHAQDHSVERYNSAGRITSHKNSRGIGIDFIYSGSKLVTVQHTAGRRIQFGWTGTQLTSVTDPNNQVYRYTYLTAPFFMLGSTTLPGTPATVISYHYEITAKPGALTGKSFNGVRYSTFQYDHLGRAILSEHSGGADRNSFAYSGSGDVRTTVHTNPLNKKTTYTFSSGRLTSVTGHASSNCPGTYKELTYDSNGYRNLVTDFADNIIDYDYSPKGELIRKVEATGTPAARETRFTWVDGRVVSETVVGVTRTDYVYRSDGLLSSTSVTNLSAVGTQSTLTTNRTYAFHANGLLKTVHTDGPLPGTQDSEIRGFDVLGNLTSIKNGLGYGTTYSQHNGLGLPARVTGPNGASIDYVYGARGRVLRETQTFDGKTSVTNNTYDNRGRLTKVVAPDVTTYFSYDNNNRLVKVYRQEPAASANSQTVDPGTQLGLLDAAIAGNVPEIINAPPCRPFPECEEDAPPPTPISQIKGYIDGIVAGKDAINGWACSTYRPAPIQVHMYVGGSAGSAGATLIGSYSADRPSGAAVAQQCYSSGSTYRFSIPLSDSVRVSYAGKPIYIHGVSPVGRSNLPITGSGSFNVPALPASTIKGNIDGVAASKDAVTGWACSTYRSDPVQVHMYLGGPAGSAGARYGASFTANKPSEAAVAQQCLSSGATYRFVIPLSDSIRTSYAGEPIYVHGISPVGGGNLLIAGSGSFRVPVLPPPPIAFQSFTYNLNGDIVAIRTGYQYPESGSGIAGSLSDDVMQPMQCHPYPECFDPPNNPTPPRTEVLTATYIDYDELGRVRARRGNNGQKTIYTYDPEGRVSSSTDAANRSTKFGYDVLGRMVTSTDPKNGVTRFAYDAGGRLSRVVDPKGHATTYSYDGFGNLWKQVSPDTGTTTFAYDQYGRRTRMTRNEGSVTTFAYDTIGRLVSRKAGGQEHRFTYDTCTNGKGRICQVWDNHGQLDYTYTREGLLKTKSQRVGSTSGLNQGYAYDAMGRLTGISYPGNVAVGYGYSNGRVAAVTATINGTRHNLATGIEHQPFGPTIGWTYGNGLKRGIVRDLDGRVTGLSTKNGTAYVQNLAYTYNANDLITRITNGKYVGATQNYGYDALARLSTNAAGPNYDWTYTYDANGNRVRANLTGAANRVDSYTTAATSNRLLSTSGGRNASFHYNANGNLIDAAGAIYRYDPFNRLTSATKGGTTTNYWVNALGQRTYKTQGAPKAAFYLHGPDGQLAAERSGFSGTWSWTHYVKLGGEIIGLVRNSKLYHVHNDHLGRPELVTSGGKSVVWRADNYAFSRNVRLDSIGGLNIGFPGQYHDAETGLWHNGFRDYDQVTGRYIQSDPIGLGGGVNTYAYVMGNPVNAVDTLGLKTCLLTTVGPGGVRDHSAVYTSRGGGSGAPALYDPAGAYGAANGGGSGAVVVGDAANIAKFTDFHNSQKVESTCKDTSQKEEESIINKAMSLPSAAPFQCSTMSSTALSGHPSFPNVEAGTFWPGNLLRQVGGP
ncbi:MAG: RHS repeat-associated core domain-containing protein [Lysobacter sp.]